MIAPLAMTLLLGDATSLFPANHDDLMVILLMLVFGMAIGVGMACLFIVLRTVRQRPEPSLRAVMKRAMRARFSEAPKPPGSWLAIAGSNLGAVQRALGIEHAAACSWQDGISAMRQQAVFLTPPLEGWILVFGAALPDPATDVDQCFLRLKALSRELGRVQYFNSQLSPLQFSWAMLDRGNVVRAHAWAGRTLWNQGAITPAELECGLTCLDYGADADAHDRRHLARMVHNAEHVAGLAGRWGIDPAAVAARLERNGLGIAGEISRTKAH